MKITKQQLVEMDACKEGLYRFIEQTNNTDEPVNVLSLIGGKNKAEDLLWLAGKTLPKEKIVRFACDCALINIEKIKPYTHECQLIIEFLNNSTASTARVAAVNASCAANAANAANAAYAAANAAYAAADADAGAAQEEINDLLKELFE